MFEFSTVCRLVVFVSDENELPILDVTQPVERLDEIQEALFRHETPHGEYISAAVNAEAFQRFSRRTTARRCDTVRNEHGIRARPSNVGGDTWADTHDGVRALERDAFGDAKSEPSDPSPFGALIVMSNVPHHRCHAKCMRIRDSDRWPDSVKMNYVRPVLACSAYGAKRVDDGLEVLRPGTRQRHARHAVYSSGIGTVRLAREHDDVVSTASYQRVDGCTIRLDTTLHAGIAARSHDRDSG